MDVRLKRADANKQKLGIRASLGDGGKCAQEKDLVFLGGKTPDIPDEEGRIRQAKLGSSILSLPLIE